MSSRLVWTGNWAVNSSIRLKCGNKSGLGSTFTTATADSSFFIAPIRFCSVVMCRACHSSLTKPSLVWAWLGAFGRLLPCVMSFELSLCCSPVLFP